MENQDYIKEKYTGNYVRSNSLDELKEFTRQLEQCVCKIKFGEKGSGTGFFCEIKNNEWNSIKALVTNNHVLNEKDIVPGKIIKISIYDDKYEYEIKIDESRKIYTDEKYDITFIELSKKDGIKDISFLQIDMKIFEDINAENYKNKNIYLLHYPKGNKAEISKGIIKNISEDNYTIIHNCNTIPGSSGAPLMNESNLKVLGIHKGSSNTKNYNLGTLLKEPINIFLSNIKSQIKEKDNGKQDVHKDNKNEEEINEKEKIIKNEKEENNDSFIYKLNFLKKSIESNIRKRNEEDISKFSSFFGKNEENDDEKIGKNEENDDEKVEAFSMVIEKN